ncbi:TPA: hypothetical protein ACXPK9_004121, partial [Salmonella enterica]
LLKPLPREGLSRFSPLLTSRLLVSGLSGARAFSRRFCVTGSPTQNGLLVITLCTDKVEKR